MTKNRLRMDNINLKRITDGYLRRITDIPHLITWHSKQGKKNSVELQKYHNTHLGERCFIVANGPSLKLTNLELLESEYSFGLNRIYLHFNDSCFRPSYYLCVNELILEQFGSEISGLVMPKFLNWNRRSLFDYEDETIIFLKSKLVLRDNFQQDITKPFVFGGTVTFVTLQLAYFMGFKEVILVGLDHKYSEKGIPNEKETRSYEKDASHFHPDYFPKGSQWQLPDLVRSEIDFRLARTFYENNNRRIIDATIGGNCQVFEKISYESLFKRF